MACLPLFPDTNIEAELGNKEEAVGYLKESIKKGMESGEDLFEFDGDFGVLMDYPRLSN